MHGGMASMQTNAHGCMDATQAADHEGSAHPARAHIASSSAAGCWAGVRDEYLTAGALRRRRCESCQPRIHHLTASVSQAANFVCVPLRGVPVVMKARYSHGLINAAFTTLTSSTAAGPQSLLTMSGSNVSTT